MNRATPQHPARRMVTAGHAVKAMGLNGLGFVNHTLSLVARFFQHQPTSQLIAPGLAPEPLHDDALGRALETLYAAGVTELYSLMAATAAERLGLAPTCAPLDRPSFHVDGRSNHDEAPDEPVVHITRGDRRDQRPDLNHVLRALMVEPHAGMPVLMKPRSGHRRDGRECGPVVSEPMEP